MKHKAFRNVRLLAGWTDKGQPSPKMRALPMIPFQAPDGCPAFQAEAQFEPGQIGQTFEWSVMVDVPGRPNIRGIMTEEGAFESSSMNRSFVLNESGSVERYWLAHGRRLGANRHYAPDRERPGIRFSVWAPNAQKVETVIAEDETSGYIWSDGRNIGQTLAMNRDEGASGRPTLTTRL